MLNTFVLRSFLASLITTTIVFGASAQTIVWQETFTGLANGTTSDAGPTAWTAYQTNAAPNQGPVMVNVGGPSVWSVDNGTLLARNVAQTGDNTRTIGSLTGLRNRWVVWESGVINISAHAGGVKVFVEIAAATVANLEVEDYVHMQYRVDGGPWQTFLINGLQNADFGRLIGVSDCATNITGNTLQIKFEVSNNTVNEFYRFDNISVIADAGTGITLPGITHSSIAPTGAWNAASTWDVNTVPTGTSVVEVTCGCVVRLTDDRSVRALVVQPGAALAWTVNDVELTFTNGASNALVINTGGALGESILGGGAFGGVNNSQIWVLGDQPFPITNNSSLVDIDLFDIRDANKPVTLSGIGLFEMRELEFSFNSESFTNNSTLLTDFIDDADGAAGGPTFTQGTNATLRLRGTISVDATDINLNAGATGNLVVYERFDNTTPANGNQNIDLPVAGNYYNLRLEGTGTKTTANGTFAGATAATMNVLGNLTLTGAASLNVDAGNDNIELHGNWLNNSTNAAPFVAGAGTEFVRFAGGNNQTVQRTASTEGFNNIQVNKTAGTVTLNSPATVAQNANFSNGVVLTTTANVLRFLDNATATGASNASHVDGPVQKVGNDAFVFPVGDAGDLGQVAIPAPNDVADVFTAQFFKVAAPNPTALAPTLQAVNYLLHWQFGQTTNAGAADVITPTLHWNDAIPDLVYDLIDTRFARWDGTTWQDDGFALASGGVPGAGAITSTVAHNYSTAPNPTFLTFGYFVDPLPIELLAFQAEANGAVADLSWATATEANNSGFWVERSTAGNRYERLGFVNSLHGTTSEVSHYTFTDANPASGRNLYRLAQTDVDGTVTYSNVAEVFFGDAASATEATLGLFPNPTAGTLNLQLPSQFSTIGTYTVLDAAGRVAQAGQLNGQLQLSVQELTHGAYTLVVRTNEGMLTQRFVRLP